ncbi:MAG TPA: hypothetical protein VF530_17005 [Planctomycetota bacterium]
MLHPHFLPTRLHLRLQRLGELTAALARARSLLRRTPLSGARHRWPDPELVSLAFFLALIGLTFVL